jgi:hypothetical protein
LIAKPVARNGENDQDAGFSQTPPPRLEIAGLRKLQICSTWNQQVALWESGRFSQTGLPVLIAGRFAKHHFPAKPLNRSAL